MKALVPRIISMFVAAPVFLVLLWLGHIPLLVGVGVIYFLGVLEFDALVRAIGYRGTWYFAISGFGFLIAGYFGRIDLFFPLTLFVAQLALVATLIEGNLAGWALTMLGTFYLGWPMGLFLLLRRSSFHVTLLFLLILWSSDILAYLFGTLIGRHRLAPYVSPKKSFEGGIAGLIAAMAVGAIGAPWLHWSPLAGAGLGGAVAVLGTLGDLFESALKRTGHLKDSGNIMPGHGGVLDRLDSVLFALPAVYYLLRGVLGH